MAELVYAFDLKSNASRLAGSTPAPGTKFLIKKKLKIYFASIAQLVEQIPLKDKVEGSIPSGRTVDRASNFICLRKGEKGSLEWRNWYTR